MMILGYGENFNTLGDLIKPCLRFSFFSFFSVFFVAKGSLLDFYTTLPHSLIKRKLIHLNGHSLEKAFFYLVYNTKRAFFASEEHTIIIERQIVGILMETNYAPFVADLFYFVMREISYYHIAINKNKR